MATDKLYTTHDFEGITVVTFQQSHILDAMTIERMATSLKEPIEGSQDAKFIFDFARVTYLSSSALGMLIGLQRRIVQRKAAVKLAGVHDDIMEVFHITKLDTVFDIYKDGRAALEAYRKHL